MARKMKDSGIEWIGEIPENWSVGRIGQLYTERKEKVSDVDFSPLSVTMKGIMPQLKTAAKTDAHDDRKLVRKGDFAINSRSDRRGSCGISHYDGSVSLINTILTPRGEMHPVYYEWLFHSTMFSDEFYKWGHGIVDDLWTTGWQDMKKISVPMPPYVDQKRIADFLDTECTRIDEIIEKTRASIEEYKKLKQSIITEAVTKGIRPNRPMKNSGIEWIGDIPKDWKCIPIKYLSSYNDEVLTENTDSNYEFDYIEIGSVEFGRGITGIEHMKFSEAPSRARRIVKKGDIIVSTVRTYLKAVASIPYSDNPLIASTGFVVIRPRKINPVFLRYAILSNAIISAIEANSVGISYPAINASEVVKLKLAIPIYEEQIEISKYLERKCKEIDELVLTKNNIISELESYKKSLIYEYVTGKKEV